MTKGKKKATPRASGDSEPSKTEQKKFSKKEQAELEKFRKKQLKIANKFTDDVLKRYKKYVKAVILFGSFTRGDFHKKSDIDMLVIIDDTIARFTPEMKGNFDEGIRVIGEKISKEITVQPAWTLTEFWEMARIGHPLLYTIVRDGWALYDSGFFIPVRKLLEAGRIPMTLEAVEQFMHGAPKKIQRAESAKLYMIAEDLYYAMLNSAQAVLMYMGENPPAPKHTPIAMKEILIKENLLEQEYADMMQEIIEFRKEVEHREIKNISGVKLDEFIEKSKKFVDRMEQLLAKLEKKRKESAIAKNYEVMIKASVSALKNMGKLPEDPKQLPKAIKEELIDKKRVPQSYADIFRQVITMRKLLDENKVNEVSEREVQLMREYVRRYVRELGPMLDQTDKKKKARKPKIKRKKR
ncbi:MAG: nucleotidyltransferase domain-containing protein [Candidatus Aenigmatarchaeota archaeon]